MSEQIPQSTIRVLARRLLAFGLLCSLSIHFSLLLGCATPKFPADFPVSLRPIVSSEVEKRDWKKFKVSSLTDEGDRWSVEVVQIPEVPGGHAQIEISKTNNRVLRYRPGN